MFIQLFHSEEYVITKLLSKIQVVRLTVKTKLCDTCKKLLIIQ